MTREQIHDAVRDLARISDEAGGCLAISETIQDLLRLTQALVMRPDFDRRRERPLV